MEKLRIIIPKWTILGLSIFMYFFVKGVDAIDCFQCNSGVDAGCYDIGFNDTKSIYYKPCIEDENTKGKTMFCRKIHQHIKDIKQTDRIIRKCGWESSPEKDCYKYEDDDHKEIVCQCLSDACNSADSSIIKRSLTYFSILVATFLIYWSH